MPALLVTPVWRKGLGFRGGGGEGGLVIGLEGCCELFIAVYDTGGRRAKNTINSTCIYILLYVCVRVCFFT